MNNAKNLLEILKHKNLTLGSAESFTGGLFAKTITDISGASAVFKGSAVVYASELKVKLLNVDPKIIETKGVVSEEVAAQLATNGQKVLGVDICVSFTGNAGPTSGDNISEVGEIYMAIAIKNSIYPFHYHLDLGRDEIRNFAVDEMIDKIIDLVENEND